MASEMQTQIDLAVGDVVKYSCPETGESDLRFLLKEHNGDRVMIELICDERIRPVEIVAPDEIEMG